MPEMLASLASMPLHEIERFHAWIAARNSRYRRVIVLVYQGEPHEYRVSSDEPHVLIGMTAYEGQHTYELIGPDDLIEAALAEIQLEFGGQHEPV